MTAGGRCGGRRGCLAPPTLGRGEPVAGLWDKDPVPLPRGRRQTVPRSRGLRPRDAPLGGPAQAHFAGAVGSPGARPGQGTLGWGYLRRGRGEAGERPGAEVGKEQRGAGRWPGGKGEGTVSSEPVS